ncbi:MAG: PIN domain-containing protein [Chloroflexi bacterium]|nr:PIN domain-containing protein [Chloroflexota bacterium]
MMRLFIDSSVPFSAAYSAQGYARDLIMRALTGDVILVVSDLVLEETRRNIAQSSPENLPLLEFVLASIPFEVVRARKSQVLAASKYTELKDAPIAAAARHAGVDLLVTLDRKHLLNKPDLAKHVGADIVTPKEAVDRLSSEGEG